jgi:hypothetical protein
MTSTTSLQVLQIMVSVCAIKPQSAAPLTSAE